MTPRQSIAHYRIMSKLGEGGMGAVYRATDTKLNRDVAIKVLPPAFAEDGARMQRFEREAQALASLNHPNIAAVYGIEAGAIVMELVEGEQPAGPLPVETVLDYARQIAAGLEAAHEKGIVHRDLKPANIKVTPDGTVKLLDFGLAKSMEAGGTAPASSPTISPTLSLSMTQAGMILGTAAYMSPEQARGQAVDKRADIWSFGVVLYELLTGRPLFEGPTVSDTLAAVLRHDPDWSAVPARFRRLLRLCLMRDPRQRLRDISGARLLLDEEVPQPPPSARRPILPWALAAAGVALAAVAWLLPRSVERPLLRFDADLGPDAVAGQRVTAAISPDGSRIVFPVRPGGSRAVQLATRLLSQSKPTVLPGTEGGVDPFFSPDGQWIGFFADGKMKKLSILGGAPVTLADAPADRGAWWAEDGMILAAPNPSDFYRVPAAGGPPLKLRNEKKFYTYRWPQALPGGEWVLVTAHVTGADYDEANIAVLSLKTEELRIVHKGGYFGRYLPGGRLLYVRQGTIFAAPFDLKTLQVSGQPVPVVDDLAPNVEQAAGQFDVSLSGTLVYLSGKVSSGPTTISWLDAAGNLTPLLTVNGTILTPRLSPDGKRLAYATEGDIFVYDIERGAPLRVTFAPSMANIYPVWAPDGRHLVYGNSKGELWWVRADGALQPERLASPGGTPSSFSPDGRYLAYHRFGEGTSRDIWMLTLDLSDADHPKPGVAEPLVTTPGPDVDPAFSPDGKWLAYSNMESGVMNVYVRRFPSRPDAGRWQISQPLGRFPIWSPNRKELYYEAPNGLMTVDFTIEGDAFRPGVPRVWSNKPLITTTTFRNLDLAPDGKRFVVMPLPEAPAGEGRRSVHVTFLLNFFDELKRRLP